MNTLRTVFWMAFRDLRAQPLGFRLYALALALGMGGMMAVASFRTSLATSMDLQARSLLGADLAVRARRAFTDGAERYLGRIAAERADELSFRTMAQFPSREATRFMQVRALEGAFPFYGTLDTEPVDAARRFQDGPFALVEGNALTQIGAEVGDPVRVGRREFVIVGRLLRAPGESPSEAFIAPRIYIPLKYVAETGLLQPGSVVSYRRYFRLADSASAAGWAERIKQDLPGDRLEVETVDTRKRALLGNVDQFSRYLGLLGFAGLLMGCIGVAGAMHSYVARRIPMVAMLRCLGASRAFCAALFLLQVLALALVGVLCGAAGAAAVLPLVAGALKSFIAAEVMVALTPAALLAGAGAGLVFSVGFAALPLLAVWRVTPAQALSSFVGQTRAWRDPLRWGLCAMLVAAVFGFSIQQAGSWPRGAGLAAGFLAAFSLLLALAWVLRGLARRIAAWIPWLPVRHGVAGLYRPGNQTATLLAAIGLGAFLLTVLHIAETSLRAQLSVYRAPDQPSLVLVDVQPDQREVAAETVRTLGHPVLNEVPIVTMRIDSLKGRPVAELAGDPDHPVPEWALRREYRSTYRADLFPTERVLRGEWTSRWAGGGEPVPISMEESIARTLHLELNDLVVWDVQGVPVPTRIASIREVDWRSMKPNFYVVFPEGAIDDAPCTYALFTQAADAVASSALQRAVADRFFNVSVIDLGLVLSSVNTILGRIADAVRGAAWFALVAGLLVVAGAVRSQREQRVRERVLMRTLGASRAHLMAVALVEHAALGLLGSLAGLLLGVAAGLAVAVWVLKTDPVIAWRLLVGGAVCMTALTATLGLSGSAALRVAPLDQLRRLEV